MAEVWIAHRTGERAAASARRGVSLRSDVEADLRLSVTPELEGAFDRLVDFALATVPDGCPVGLEATGPLETVAPVGAGQLTLRWQISGPRDRAPQTDEVTPIRPLPGDAQAHLESARLRRICGDFEAAGWRVVAEALADGRELFVRAASG